MDGNISEGIGMLMVLAAISICSLVILGITNVIDFFFTKDTFETTEIVVPEIKLIIEDNKVDTVYIYREP
jgi:hypothetical protein